MLLEVDLLDLPETFDDTERDEDALLPARLRGTSPSGFRFVLGMLLSLAFRLSHSRVGSKGVQ